MLFRLLIMLTVFTIAYPVVAGDIKLNADKQVEYHQKEQKLIAVGNAIATKDSMSIRAERLIGYYSPESKNKISRIEAHDKVVLTSDQTQASGNKLIYDIKSDSATLSGTPARIKNPDAELTSNGTITFWLTAQKAVSDNPVTAIDKQGNIIHADHMTAYFSKDSAGKLSLDKIDISGNVKINANETEITANSGTYYAIDGKIKLFENIVINQKDNILRGSQAETDLNTGISKILSGNTGRVSGVFKETKKEKNK